MHATTCRFVRAATALLVAAHLFACSAPAPGALTPADADTDARADLGEASSGDRQRWVALIAASGAVDIAAIDAKLDRIRADLVLGRYLEGLYRRHIDEERVRAHYEAHAEDFSRVEIPLSHILLSWQPGADEHERAAVRTHAQELSARLHRGESFAALAREASADERSADRDGALGWVGRGAIADQLFEAALALPADGISEPIETRYGLHILHKQGEERRRQLPIEQVKAGIVSRLRAALKAEIESNLQAGIVGGELDRVIN